MSAREMLVDRQIRSAIQTDILRGSSHEACYRPRMVAKRGVVILTAHPPWQWERDLLWRILAGYPK